MHHNHEKVTVHPATPERRTREVALSATAMDKDAWNEILRMSLRMGGKSCHGLLLSFRGGSTGQIGWPARSWLCICCQSRSSRLINGRHGDILVAQVLKLNPSAPYKRVTIRVKAADEALCPQCV